MDPLRLLTQDAGFFTRPEAHEAGYDDRAIAQMVRGRIWTRFRRGFYAFTDEWSALDDIGRHLVVCRAVLRSLGPAVALSHVSGVVAHGINVWGVPLSRVHVTRLDRGAGRHEGDVVHHEGVCIDGDVVEVNGLRVLRPERCVLEAGSRASNEMALCMFDSGLHLKRFDPDQLAECHQLLQFWPNMRHLHIPVRMADGRRESVGESRGTWLFHTSRVPTPVFQYPVHDVDGSLIGVCDWAWPEHEGLGEFDGRVKYGRTLREGQDVGEVVFAEKHREDRMREATRFAMVRIIWTDYDRPRLTAARVERLLRRR
jgi:hypothetical protein